MIDGVSCRNERCVVAMIYEMRLVSKERVFKYKDQIQQVDSYTSLRLSNLAKKNQNTHLWQTFCMKQF